tara:strand:- start:1409 stop:1801 length:393 start_codon:yes stop_codon:yes gene_type:complete
MQRNDDTASCFDRTTLFYGDAPHRTLVRAVPFDAFRAMLARRNVHAEAAAAAAAYRALAASAPAADYERAASDLARAEAAHAAAIAARARGPRGGVAPLREYERRGGGGAVGAVVEEEGDGSDPWRLRLG